MISDIKILLLEDNPDDADLVEFELRREGVSFLSRRVETEKSFLRELQEFTPDIILADYTLPAFDGLTALAAVKEHDPFLPFIFVTGTMGEEKAIETFKRGATDYVLKDNLTRLVPAIRRACSEAEGQRARIAADSALKAAYAEIKGLKDRLEAENSYLKQEIDMVHDQKGLIGRSDTFKYVLYRAKQFAETDATVLLLGETGTGKSAIAQMIHRSSSRRNRPLVHVNCAALPSNLIESELFGREKGAFTGALEKQIGRFELAHRGTIFLDEIGELPLELQSKLLRVLEDGTFERLGSPNTVSVDVRVIAATNHDLAAEAKNGSFREDLYYRLNILPITIPPLRQRADDIPHLAEFFIGKFNRKYSRHVTAIPSETLQLMMTHSWPGNIRELINVIERSVLTSAGSTLHLMEKLGSALPPRHGTEVKTLGDIERSHILNILQEVDWKIQGPGGAAHLLGLNPSTLRARIRKLGIKRALP